MKYRYDDSCYLLAKGRIKWRYVKCIFVVILLEINITVAGKATHQYSKRSNISYTRGKRQVSFGGKSMLQISVHNIYSVNDTNNSQCLYKIDLTNFTE